MDNQLDSLGMVTYWWSHSMISDRSYRSILSLCNFTLPEKSPVCRKAIDYAMNNEIGNIDPYNIYAPSCPVSSAKAGQSLRLLKSILLRRRLYGYAYDPCTENYAEVYYNRPDVQKAMHANSTGIPYKWTACRSCFLSLPCRGCNSGGAVLVGFGYFLNPSPTWIVYRHELEHDPNESWM